MRLLCGGACVAAWAIWASNASAKGPDIKVCVEVVVQRPTPKRPIPPPGAPIPSPPADPETPRPREPAANVDSVVSIDPDGSRDVRVQSGAHLPLGQTPEAYLKRLLEYFVMHEPGFVAVQTGCGQRIIVELYPLRLGWTAFARYSGTGREERVDQLLPTELSQFAERSVLALLHDRSIQQTVDRKNVLWADSLRSTQVIRGRVHAVLGLGTRVRVGRFDTVITDESSSEFGATQEEPRIFTPMALTVGFRGQFEEFGVETMAELDIATSQAAASSNPTGGHIDFGGSTAIVLHALRYADVRGLTSLYYGAGASFALHWFNAIRSEETRDGDNRSTLFGGGLDVDAIFGYEFMRASALSFFLQGELNIPAYAVQSENDVGSVRTWFPGAALKLGAIF